MTIRRLKTYAGAQGYVYQYYFVGKRPTSTAIEALAAASADEYIFDVTSDRRSTHAVSILFPHAAAKQWAEAHGRSLSDSEQYAAVKMRLFRAFDEGEILPRSEAASANSVSRRIVVDLDFLNDSLAGLEID